MLTVNFSKKLKLTLKVNLTDFNGELFYIPSWESAASLRSFLIKYLKHTVIPSNISQGKPTRKKIKDDLFPGK